jgi:hypothetical protein
MMGPYSTSALFVVLSTCLCRASEPELQCRAQGSLASIAEQAEYRTEWLTGFYERQDPSKVGKVAAALDHFRGKERHLFQKLEDKYGVTLPEGDWLRLTTLDVFFVVITAPQNAERRQVLRDTWLNSARGRNGAIYRFMVGEATPVQDELLQQENATYGDIVRLEGVADSYRNLPHKVQGTHQLVGADTASSFQPPGCGPLPPAIATIAFLCPPDMGL